MNDINKNEKFSSGPLKILYIALGVFFVGLGVAGIFIPVLPTTPFILVAAALFARSSTRFYDWLINNKIFGRYIRNYRKGKGIPLKIKISAIIFLWITIGCSAIFAVDVFWVRFLLVITAAGVTIHIILIRPKNKNGQAS